MSETSDGAMITSQSLAEHLSTLGVRPGDTVLVRAAAKAVGPTKESPTKVLVEALLACLGESGTLVALTFSQSGWAFRKSRAPTFERGMATESGGFASTILAQPKAVRSEHPTNSFTAIGPHAQEIVRGHDHRATCFFPLKALMGLNGKMLLVGCTESSPGFSTVHLAQEDLGLAVRTWESGLTGAFYRDGVKTHWFARRDVSGCSRGFGKFYSHYERRSLLQKGYIGKALSYLIDASDAYATERELLAADPRIGLCDNSDCVSCGLRTYVPTRLPVMLAALAMKRLFGKRKSA